MIADVSVRNTHMYTLAKYTQLSGNILLDLSAGRTHTEPEYVDDQFQRDPLDVQVELVLPRSSLRPLLTDVSAAGTVALTQVKINLQCLTPAEHT